MKVDLVERALGLLSSRERIIVGIAGPPGAGKSTVAERLVTHLRRSVPTAWMPMDGFHLADTELIRLGRIGAKGAIDTFDVHGYLATLRRARTETANIVYAPEFDRTLEQPIAGGMPVLPGTRIVVTEGNYLLDATHPWNLVVAELDECWYVNVDDHTRRSRLVARHVLFGKSPEAAYEWVRSVDDANALTIADSRARADLIIQSDQIEPAVDAAGEGVHQ